MEKSDSAERADDWEDRRLPFSLADSSTLTELLESGRERRGMARGKVGKGMLAVGGLNFQPFPDSRRGEGGTNARSILDYPIEQVSAGPPFCFLRGEGRGSRRHTGSRWQLEAGSGHGGQYEVTHPRDRRRMTVLSVVRRGMTRGVAAKWRLWAWCGWSSVPYSAKKEKGNSRKGITKCR